MKSKVEAVKRYLKLVADLELTSETTDGLLHSEYLQWELPNILNPKGQKSDLADTLKRMSVAKQIVEKQTYNVTRAIEQEDLVIIEALWEGQFRIDAGPIKKGEVYKAFFCMFFDFKAGLIHRVKNYDCFEPFA